MNKKFVKYFILTSIFLLALIFSFNLSIDPYDKYRFNLFDIEHKLTRNDRNTKLEQLKKLDNVDNLIIGSSRSQTLNPQIVSTYLNGITYNFGVGGGKIEDFLGLVLYLERNKKLPKNILLALDFNAFNSKLDSHKDFYKSNELNFLKNYKENFQLSHFLSIDTTRSSFKTLKAHLKNEEPSHYFNEYGFIIGPTESKSLSEIKQESLKYFKTQYSNGDFILDKTRISYFKRLISLIKRHQMNLKVIITPVSNYQMSLIKKNSKLEKEYKLFLNEVSNSNTVINFMEIKRDRSDDSYFVDSVHYSEKLGNKILDSIYQKNNISFE